MTRLKRELAALRPWHLAVAVLAGILAALAI